MREESRSVAISLFIVMSAGFIEQSTHPASRAMIDFTLRVSSFLMGEAQAPRRSARSVGAKFGGARPGERPTMMGDPVETLR